MVFLCDRPLWVLQPTPGFEAAGNTLRVVAWTCCFPCIVCVCVCVCVCVVVEIN